MGEDSLSFLTKYFRTLELEVAEERYRRYASKDFPNQLGKVGRALKELNVDSERLEFTLKAGGKMIDQAKTLSPWDWGIIRRHSELQRVMMKKGMTPLDTPDDSFYTFLWADVNDLVARKSGETAEGILHKVDSDFSGSASVLASGIPTSMEKSRTLVLQALFSFKEGRKVEAAAYTRRAWEACVNYALSKLPKAEGLNSLNKKSKYVLEMMEQKDKSRSMTDVKNLFEGRFLHEIESEESLPEPEVPFYIALTLGFVHLVAAHLKS